MGPKYGIRVDQVVEMRYEVWVSLVLIYNAGNRTEEDKRTVRVMNDEG